MKMHETIRCKRLALGLTQAEFGEIVGVSGATISAFELGKEVSQSVFNNIKYGLDRLIHELSSEEYQEMLLVSMAYGLAYESDQEKLKTLQYMTMAIGKLGIGLMKKVNV